MSDWRSEEKPTTIGDWSSAIGRHLVWLAALMNLAITIPLAVILNILLDEAYTLNTTGQGIKYAWHQAIHFELQPPLFFVLLSIWRKFGDSILFARFFSVICGVIVVKLAFDLAKRYVPGIPPILIALVVAIHPFVIWAAEDIRVYAFVLLLSSILMLLFYDGYLAENGPRWKRWAYVAVAVCALYTQYYLGFLLLANAVVLLLQGRRRTLLNYVGGMCIAGLIFLPMAPTVYQQIFQHTKDTAGHDTVITSIKDFTWIIKGHLLPAESLRLETARRWIQWIGIPVLLILVILNWKRTRMTGFAPIWIVTLVMLPIFLAVRYRLGYDLFSPKHTATLFLPCVLSAFALAWIAARRLGVYLWTTLMALACVLSLMALYNPPVKEGDWRHAAEYLQAREAPDQPIVLFSSTAVWPFGYYYHGPNRLIPLPHAEALDTYDIQAYVLHTDGEINSALVTEQGLPPRIWMVTDSFCRVQSVDFNCPLLEDFLNRYYVVESDQQFHGSRVRLMHRR